MSSRAINTVRELIDHQAQHLGDSVYLIDPTSKTQATFVDLRRAAIRVAKALFKIGLKKRSKYAYVLPNGLAATEILFGGLYGGAVPVPLNQAAETKEWGVTIAHGDVEVIVAEEEYIDKARDAAMASSIQPLVVSSKDFENHTGSDGALPTVTPDDDALLLYTSGTTGVPKGILLSQGNVVVSGRNSARAHGLTTQDRALCVMPMSHINALTVSLMATLETGGSVVVPGSFDRSRFWLWLMQHRCTWSAINPSFIVQLLDCAKPFSGEENAALTQLRFIRSSAAALMEKDHLAFEQSFGVRLQEAMGSTEAGGTFFSNPPPPRTRKVGSPGLPWGYNVRIVDEWGERPPDGDRGEIWIQGPAVMKGYYKNADATAKVLTTDGWLQTGDVGYLDSDGYVYIVGRLDELVNINGRLIALTEIDRALTQDPSIAEAATVKAFDPVSTTIEAFIALKPNGRINEDSLREHCRSQLEAPNLSLKFHAIEKLPRSAGGKIQRRRLMELAASRELVKPTPTGKENRRTLQGSGSVIPKLESLLVASPSPVEEALAKIWVAVLGIDRVGIHDTFMELGGNSLLATQVISRVLNTFHVEVPLRLLLESPTVADMAVIIAQIKAKKAEGTELPRMLTELESLSDEEARKRLADEEAKEYSEK